MSVHNPHEFDQIFAKAFNGRETDALVALYEPDATLVPEPGRPVTGRDAPRDAPADFMRLNGQIDLRTAGVIVSGDIAMVYSDWALIGGADPGGDPGELADRSTVVLRRQPDGTWLGAIDDPWSKG